MKIAVVTDSNSGISREEGEQLGLFVLPMPFLMAGQRYLKGIVLCHVQFYRRL